MKYQKYQKHFQKLIYHLNHIKNIKNQNTIVVKKISMKKLIHMKDIQDNLHQI